LECFSRSYEALVAGICIGGRRPIHMREQIRRTKGDEKPFEKTVCLIAP